VHSYKAKKIDMPEHMDEMVVLRKRISLVQYLLLCVLVLEVPMVADLARIQDKQEVTFWSYFSTGILYKPFTCNYSSELNKNFS
jgi:hypothetical protein